ncbi:dienelactone hydrolase family protein [Microbulbifer hainanensis]|uniref:dienelactone hydrolase family protein n=1 Tax=Microbulbifer hainanensis TaxID=2735675 RepID=UPI0018671DE1|nr:dienelactone hydrolase family protein [Microbulbifer hainanensis]
MCDEITAKEAEAYLRRKGISRRTFTKTGLGAALGAMLPGIAFGAMKVAESDVRVTTPDGEADAYFVHPAKGRHPAVILWPDIFGIRPAFRQMGKRLAEQGYAVLVVNPYYRNHRGPLVPGGADVIGPEVRQVVMPEARKLAGTLSPDTAVSDGRAFVKFLDAQPAVDTERKIGVMGYCMTGSYTLRLGAAMPERIGAGASFHGGGLVTDRADSPHLLIPKLKGGYLIAIAENDDARQPEAKTVLREAFDRADADAEIEVYKGTLHGWCPTDSAAYNEDLAERAWARMQALFARELT